MSQIDYPSEWGIPRGGSSQPSSSQQLSDLWEVIDSARSSKTLVFPSQAESDLWELSKVTQKQGVSNVDDLPPEAMFYLGRVVDIPHVTEVYAEESKVGSLKIWTVLKDREFDVMDEIYDIEQEVLDRFPGVDIQFRVTIQSDKGPSITSTGTRIFNRP